MLRFLKSANIWYVGALVAVVVFGARYLHQQDDESPPSGQAPVAVADHRSEEIVVHVTGAVKKPGVYRLKGEPRVGDALKRAGGLAKNADPIALNLASKIEDGRQIVVPKKGGRSGAAGGEGTSSSGDGAVNLNTASAEELQKLDGVGPATAEKILAYRREHGGFGSVDDLQEVSGIGEKRLEALRPKVTV